MLQSEVGTLDGAPPLGGHTRKVLKRTKPSRERLQLGRDWPDSKTVTLAAIMLLYQGALISTHAPNIGDQWA